ncbi:MAG: hypothetical protein WCE90_10070 [Candidatus Zixiibacteriota bacterium]
MSFSNDIRIIGLGSMGSEVATLIGRYQREGEQKIRLSEDERNILKKALSFVDNMKQGYLAVETRKFNINSEAPFSYSYYLKVRRQLSELGQVKQVQDFENDIKMFAEILKELGEGKTLAEIDANRLDKVGKFFSRLSDFALEELYVINNEKREIESL